MKTLARVSLLVAVAALAALPRHTVIDRTGLSQLLWHDDEAFVFLAGGVTGRSGSYAWHALSRLSALGAPPQDTRPATTVFRITTVAVEKWVLDGAVPRLFVADGFVVAGDSRFSGGRFEHYVPRSVHQAFLMPGTVARADGPRKASDIYPLDDFSGVEGWTKRTFSVGYGHGRNSIDFSISGRPAQLKISVDSETRSVDLGRAGSPDIRLTAVSNRPRDVSTSEYRRLFQSSPGTSSP